MACVAAACAVAALLAASGCGSPTAPTPPPAPAPAPVPEPTPTPTPVPDPPSLTCPAAMSASTTSASGTEVSYTTPTAAAGDPPVTVACTPASGTTFPIGTTAVQCTATDARSRTASCAFSVTVTLTPQLSKTKFLSFGDSITAGEVSVPTTGVHPTGSPYPSFRLALVPSTSYPTVLQALLAARYTAQTNITVTNEGLAGEKASAGTLRFSQALRTHSPEVVLLLHGYNGLTEEGGASSSEVAVATMAAEARNRGVRVFVATLTPGRPGAARAIPDGLIQNFNDRMRNLARGEGAVLVDLYSALASNVNTYIGVDGLHPTEAGYRKMAETFLASIQANLETR